ncbi:hypothetical protein HYN46_07990 [Aquirhabdus parva]|uniref:Bacteriocin n=2 Tax=Aquirhabdus parva TaxID=2283318 RepID=A0A345P671_9GAMM|nr:hypothetical protein HYN46_07990 [Aquirhabdus parva]
MVNEMSTLRELNVQEIDQVSGGLLGIKLPVVYPVSLNVVKQVDIGINALAVAGLTAINAIGANTKSTALTNPLALGVGALYLGGAGLLLQLQHLLID